jgi:hypothetical protein
MKAKYNEGKKKTVNNQQLKTTKTNTIYLSTLDKWQQKELIEYEKFLASLGFTKNEISKLPKLNIPKILPKNLNSLTKEELLDLLGLKGKIKVSLDAVDKDKLLSIFAIHEKAGKNKFRNIIRRSAENIKKKIGDRKKTKKENENIDKEIPIIPEKEPEKMEVEMTNPIEIPAESFIEEIKEEKEVKIDIGEQEIKTDIKPPVSKSWLEIIKENKIFVAIVTILILVTILLIIFYILIHTSLFKN